ncbi:unnamed protein product, partial [Mesorhabditis belari]|uniref:Latrophilin Cirl n=1 Tax=Mesorhabditis belari TaxID=2138241 RepID=A0AAF3FFM3_9BILA
MNGIHTRPICEDREAELVCPLGTVISVTLANYGRFSMQECNPAGDTELRVDCANPATKEILEKLCSGKKTCIFKVDKYLFNDPCPGTSKYLEASYTCEEETTTTTTTTPSTTTLEGKDVDSGEKSDEIGKEIDSEAFSKKKCLSTRKEGFDWPTTAAGHTHHTKCTDERHGEMEWNCEKTGEWAARGPNTNGCWSEWTETRRNQMNEAAGKDDYTGIADVIRQLRADSKRPMAGGDLRKIVNLLESATERIVATPESRPVRKQITSLVIEIGQNVNKNKEIWQWSSGEEKRDYGSRLMDTVEQLTISAGLGKGESTESYVQPLIRTELAKIKLSHSEKENYFVVPSMAMWDSNRVDTVDIPKEAFVQLQQKDTSEVYYSQWESLGDFMEPPPQQIVREVAGKKGVFKEGERVRKIVSRIIGASILADGKAKNVGSLGKPVVLSFHHSPEALRGLANAECVFWNKQKIKWDNTGCRLNSHNESLTVCLCDHLTHFAVLMDFQGHELSTFDEQMLTFITYAGCTVSIFCLLFTFVAFQCFSQGGGDRVFIHKNLCLSLVLAEMVFLFGIWQTDKRLECSIIAGVLMYLFLAALTWMLLEGFQLYHMLVEVFPKGSKKIRLFVVGYGLPLFSVIGACFHDTNGFGTQKHCWLRSDSLFTLWFIVPAGIILCANTGFLVMTLCIVCRHSNGGYLPCKREEDGGRSVRTWVKGAMGVSCLLGVTWTFGLLWVDDGKSIVAAYTFTIFNSLQGLFIFLFHVAFSEKMRRDARKWFSRRGCVSSESDSKRGNERQSPNGSASGTGSEFLYPSTAGEVIKYGLNGRAVILESDGRAFPPNPYQPQAIYGADVHGHPVYQYQHLPPNHPRLVHHQQQHPYHTQIHAPIYEYDTISYGDMLPNGQIFRSPPPFVSRTLQRSPYQQDSHRGSPQDFRLGYPGYPGPTAPDLHQPHFHRPPPEFSPPPPPAEVPRNLAAAAQQHLIGTTSAGVVAMNRRPPSSKASDDSAYSEHPFPSSRYDDSDGGRSSVLTHEVIPNGSTVLRIDLSKNPPIFAHEV